MNKLMKKEASRLEKAQGLVEFAVSIVIVLILLAGVLDLGRALFTFITLRDAAQEGAIYGSINPTDYTNIESRVRNSTNTPVDLTDTTNIQVSSTVIGSACAGNGIQITVTYPNFSLTTPFLGSILGSQTIPIRATVTDTILRPPCQ